MKLAGGSKGMGENKRRNYRTIDYLVDYTIAPEHQIYLLYGNATNFFRHGFIYLHSL